MMRCIVESRSEDYDGIGEPARRSYKTFKSDAKRKIAELRNILNGATSAADNCQTDDSTVRVARWRSG